eukprot:10689553-Alexandrium_andersonii.AAC.1
MLAKRTCGQGSCCAKMSDQSKIKTKNDANKKSLAHKAGANLPIHRPCQCATLQRRPRYEKQPRSGKA